MDRPSHGLERRARLRGNATAAVENVTQWHDRDISHSCAERVILPDSTVMLDILKHLTIRVVRDMSR
jgi:adenylosuccinate lyase